MYEKTIGALIVIGLIFSSAYVLTWTPGAIKAKVRGTTTMGNWDIVDFAALPWACFLILWMNALNALDSGITFPGTPGLVVQRIFSLAFVVAIVILRCVRWARTYLEADEADRASGAALTPTRSDRSS